MDTLVTQTDWLKDYDPLFDLFDEEMSATGQATFTSDYFCDYDLTSHLYCPYKTDELSIFLGLEWMPCLDLGSPAPSSPTTSASTSACFSASTSTSTSAANSSPASPASSTTAYHTVTSQAPRSVKKKKRSQKTKGTSLLAQNQNNLTSRDKSVRYCVKVEHAYSLSHQGLADYMATLR